MPPSLKRYGRVAAAIGEAVHQPPTVEAPALPITSWEELQREQRRLAKARSRGFQLAARRLAGRLTSAVDRLRADLLRVEIGVARPSALSQYPAAEIARDLVELEAEFPEVESAASDGTIAVVTNPIELDDVYLGPFRIVLDWREMATADSPYSVEAVDPQPAEPNEEVTHPHVSSERLCEGEGRSAIRAALREGRLLDFFLLIRQILGTYNPSSAYVRIEDWSGIRCVDCSDWVGADDRSECERCGVDLCTSCVWSCAACYQLLCSECRDVCYGCDENHCHNCLTEGDDGPLCESCLEQQEPDDPEEPANETTDEASNEETTTRPAAPKAAVARAAANPNGMGQADLPA